MFNLGIFNIFNLFFNLLVFHRHHILAILPCRPHHSSDLNYPVNYLTTKMMKMKMMKMKMTTAPISRCSAEEDKEGQNDIRI